MPVVAIIISREMIVGRAPTRSTRRADASRITFIHVYAADGFGLAAAWIGHPFVSTCGGRYGSKRRVVAPLAEPAKRTNMTKTAAVREIRCMVVGSLPILLIGILSRRQ